MEFSKKWIAGIAALVTTVSYALYRRGGTDEGEDAAAETDAPVA
jgi:hypothetical protein